MSKGPRSVSAAVAPTPPPQSLAEAFGISGEMNVPESDPSSLVSPMPAADADDNTTTWTESIVQKVLWIFLIPFLLSNAVHMFFSPVSLPPETLVTFRPSWYADVGWMFLVVTVIGAVAPELWAVLRRKVLAIWAVRWTILWWLAWPTFFYVGSQITGLIFKLPNLAMEYWRTGRWVANERVFAHRFDKGYIDWATNDAPYDGPLEVSMAGSRGLWPDYDNFIYGLHPFCFFASIAIVSGWLIYRLRWKLLWPFKNTKFVRYLQRRASQWGKK